ncbi:ATP-binding cassette domain-containing protein [Pontibacter sp. SGAir0037]|uniref:ATP-binding cassette domain-containing protein n=1 Tax=Pontibacter sp. SGAir0037 TaxID=2571030 RepID=UPI0010CCD180|nr:ATP-binding cassette domain-containing protein [Pontibacter sp. SGAir0037]QCR21517.1 ABC transporter ATP-binding protein [Pontibacter sp. SGAir0037]
MSHKLEVDSIQLAFNDRRILSDIYLKCETGKITGLLGRNGQGKSCLMKIIYGSMPCEKSVRFDQKVQFEAFKRPDLLLYLPQFNFIPRSLSLKRIFKDFNLDFAVFQHRFPEFSSRYRSSVGSLSGGGQRLVEIYVIVKSSSCFAMLDEPFSHLNPMQIEKVKELLLEEKEHKGLLITDHMYRHILDLSDNLYVLEGGKTHLTKTIEDIEMLGYARL